MEKVRNHWSFINHNIIIGIRVRDRQEQQKETIKDLEGQAGLA